MTNEDFIKSLRCKYKQHKCVSNYDRAVLDLKVILKEWWTRFVGIFI